MPYHLTTSIRFCIPVITGGLDSKLVMWDFSKGRPRKIVDFSMCPVPFSPLLISVSLYELSKGRLRTS